MKTTLLTLLFFGLFISQSHAAFNYDGCYQLYMPNVMYPSFCLDGTNEEGINGSGVRLVLFSTNTDLISACAISSALSVSGNSLEYILGTKKELILSNAKIINSRLAGTATFGKTSLKFIQINSSTSEHLLSKFYSEPKCKNLNVGEIIKLR